MQSSSTIQNKFQLVISWQGTIKWLLSSQIFIMCFFSSCYKRPVLGWSGIQRPQVFFRENIRICTGFPEVVLCQKTTLDDSTMIFPFPLLSIITQPTYFVSFSSSISQTILPIRIKIHQFRITTRHNYHTRLKTEIHYYNHFKVSKAGPVMLFPLRHFQHSVLLANDLVFPFLGYNKIPATSLCLINKMRHENFMGF